MFRQRRIHSFWYIVFLTFAVKFDDISHVIVLYLWYLTVFINIYIGLTFCGIRGEHNHRKYACSYQHKIGHVIVHLGEQRHGADVITSGERHNLIIWNKSNTYRKSEVFKCIDIYIITEITGMSYSLNFTCSIGI